MLAVVKRHPIDFTVRGTIPAKYIELLKQDFGDDVFIQEDSEPVDVTTMEWYQDLKAEETPGDTLRFYRKLNKLTQVQLAVKLNVAKQYVSNMENGLKPISRKMAQQLSEIFGIKAGRFI